MPKTPSRPMPDASPLLTGTPTPTPLEATNPAGAPDGTDHGHAGTLSETPGTPLGAPGATQPTAADLGATTDTQTDALAPGGTTDGPVATQEHPSETLRTYLDLNHPGEVQEHEHPATTAIRLLTRLGAAGQAQARCTAPYCNLPASHHGEHGWVHVEPATSR